MENVKENGSVPGGGEKPAEESTQPKVDSNAENQTDSKPSVNGDSLDAGERGTTSPPPPNSSLARMPVQSESFRYSGSHKHRGHCVIFNHRFFDRATGLGERNGTDRDRDEVRQLFLQLEFDVKVHDNMSVGEIKEVLQDLAFSTDHTDCDMLVVIFMSHGEQDVLWGRDAHFKPDALFECFQADQCKSLAGKPKIFFIQACRGEGLDSGVTLVRSRPSDETDSGRLAYKIPTTADFLICWSTVPGHYSWRNTTNGSWFMQSLVHVLRQEAGHEDLLSMMTSVNRHMILNFESNTPSQQHMHGKKQSANIVSTLMRKVFLTPKY